MLMVDWSHSTSTPIGGSCACAFIGTSKHNMRIEISNTLFMFPPNRANISKVMNSLGGWFTFPHKSCLVNLCDRDTEPLRLNLRPVIVWSV